MHYICSQYKPIKRFAYLCYRERQRQTDRQTDTERETERETKTDRETKRERQRQTDRQTDRQRPLKESVNLHKNQYSYINTVESGY